MSKQFMAFAVQDVSRDAAAVAPTTMFYAVKGKLEPVPEYKEDPASEWRGQDTAQGHTGDNEDRTSAATKYEWESRIYPGIELATIFKYLFGTSLAPVALSAPNAAADLVIYKTTSEPYGEGTQLLDTALELIPNTRKGATTYSQSFLGHRPKDASLDFKGGEAADFKMNTMSGPWIGTPGQTETAGVSFPAAKAFKSVPKVYMGAGATITGTGAAITDFAPGTMPVVKPDDLSIKLDLGIDDIHKMNGVDGPSVTERTKELSIVAEFTVDFSDPASGWSSYDAWVAQFSGQTKLPFMMILDHHEIIPSCSTQKYQLGLYMPRAKVTLDPVDRKNNGSKDKVKVKVESRVDPAVNIAAFGKLIY